jgi:RNA polymerase sigma-70 factor (ECF subfamily)
MNILPNLPTNHQTACPSKSQAGIKPYTFVPVLGIFTLVKNPLQIAPFMLNKPNFLESQMNVCIFSQNTYENISDWTLGKNKPNQTQSSLTIQKNISTVFYKCPLIKILIRLQITYNDCFWDSFRVEFMKPVLKKLTDAELLDRYAAGEETAFREIVNRYKNGLYTFLTQFLNRRDMVEDVFQETFLQLFTSRDSFDTSRPLHPWLFTIAANKAKDALRKQQRTAAIPIGTIAESQDLSFDDVLNTLSSDRTTPYEKLEKSETASRVGQVIANMPENLREILILAYFNKFSYKQMAQILSIPIGTVKSRLHTAVGRFGKDWKASVGSEKTK